MRAEGFGRAIWCGDGRSGSGSPCRVPRRNPRRDKMGPGMPGLIPCAAGRLGPEGKGHATWPTCQLQPVECRGRARDRLLALGDGQEPQSAGEVYQQRATALRPGLAVPTP